MFPPGFFIILPVTTVVALFIAGFMAASGGGWNTLLPFYPTTEPFEGNLHSFVSGKMGLANYGSCLKVGVNDRGLYLWVILPLQISHKPLFIPWSEITAKQVQIFKFFTRVQLNFAKAPSVWLALGKPFILKLKEESPAAARTFSQII